MTVIIIALIFGRTTKFSHRSITPLQNQPFLVSQLLISLYLPKLYAEHPNKGTCESVPPDDLKDHWKRTINRCVSVQKFGSRLQSLTSSRQPMGEADSQIICRCIPIAPHHVLNIESNNGIPYFCLGGTHIFDVCSLDCWKKKITAVVHS